MKNWLHGLFSTVFWLWNLTFLGIVYFGILPGVGLSLIQATAEGLIPLEFSLTLLGLIAVPTVCALLGIRLRKKPLQLIRLFYGVEAPLFALALIRLFLLRELTPASSWMVATTLLCIGAFGVQLFYGYARSDRKIASLQLLAHSLMLLMGLYFGALLLFYALPATVSFLGAILSFQWLGALWRMLQYDFFSTLWWVPIFFLLFGFSCTLFLAMPSALASFYIHAGYRVLREFAQQYGRNRAVFGSVAVITSWMVVFLAVQQQPQVQAFKLLETPATTEKARQELVTQSDAIRNGLTNAYLSRYRYLSTVEDNNHIGVMYQNVLGLNEASARVVQNWYNQLMSPLLYKGSRQDIKKAEKLYAEFFDTPIQKGERSQILHAVQSTANREEAKAGVLNIDEKRVWLAEQEITVTENGEWADVELYEVYENQTYVDEEVFYYFSLPESAVLTGVWLNETADRSDRYTFQISPRGAAQQVYNNQVRRNVDPALLEQVGPRQYRLRVFPVPARLSEWDETEKEQPKQHMWLTYKVLQSEKGWALPELAEKRNVFWTKKTARIYNGKTIKGDDEAWMPSFIAAKASRSPKMQQVTLPGNYTLTAKPLAATDYAEVRGQRVAAIVDRSYSMKSHAKELAQTFQWLQKHGFSDRRLDNNDADLYLTATGDSEPTRLDDIGNFNPSNITFYGSLQFKEMLQQFQQLRGDTTYDAIVLITDEGSYELADNDKAVMTMSAPLWMVHLGGLPRAYDDATLKAIQDSRGGVESELSRVLQRLATQEKLGDNAVSVVDGYGWLVQNEKPPELAKLPAAIAKAQGSKSSLEPLAARQLILALSKEMDPNNLAELDAIHAIAKKYEIVSPYSSAIVLVNEAQKQELKEAESKSDRFDREVEDGQEQLTQPNDPLNVAVPEPHQWLGTIAAIGLLILAKRKLAKV
ncbi:TIGR02921 family PEP-CTERM protein [Phormidium sp. CCY1219]|uniref:TIGR02921 family PEP-CTERM protein n=1 Tax=Phormidium sp. CCY1219 TaxID=2886104 RepID=UPI002D1E68D3|nr:TIGR02921 family PEP-CTERM protein [Phormidium sp. CCY1219]MEB3829588.1 TIGR02921 family PEP-CTERM protein [Phormidium sp. CCY1219]